MIETIRLGNLRWSHIVRPTDEDLKALTDHFHFHPLDIEDCRSLVNLRPKIDVYENYYFLILHFPSFNVSQTFVETKEIKIFWGKDFLITLGKSHWLVKEMFLQEKNRVQGEPRPEAENSDALLYRILEKLMQETQSLVEKIEMDVDSCGKAMFSRHPEKTIEKMSITRKNVVLLNTMFKPQIQLFHKLQSGAIEGFAGDMEDYWGNILDFYQKTWDTVEDAGELIKGYSFTFDSLQVSRTNQVLKILTLVSSVLLPLIFIASLYGMNMRLPIQNHPALFMIVVGVMVMVAVVMVILVKFRRWM